MKRVLILLIAVFVAAAVTANMVTLAQDPPNNTLEIVAEIRPQRLVIVDDQLRIVKIYSNTAEDVRPLIYLNSLDGSEIPYSSSIQSEYASLKAETDSSKPGVVYERKEKPVEAYFQRIWSSVRSFFAESF